MQASHLINIYLEVGSKRTFAGAIDWPGWCRSGRDESSAMVSLFDYGPRYARALKGTRLEFRPPPVLADLVVAERLKGGTTTDFGAPEFPPSADSEPVDGQDIRRLQSILRACWRAFDNAAASARGKELRKGPRGGGRNLDGIVQHVLGAEEAYLARLGWKRERGSPLEMGRIREDIVKALAAAANHELPELGPRGGRYWTPRYFCRRAAWHILDHAWEVEDRAASSANT